MFLVPSLFFFFFFCLLFYFIYLFIYYLWLCWVFISVRGLPPAAASGGHSSSWCAGLSLSRPLSLRSTGSRRAGSAIVAHGPSRSAAYGILPDQGSNPWPCIGRQILNHCATREAPLFFLTEGNNVFYKSSGKNSSMITNIWCYKTEIKCLIF